MGIATTLAATLVVLAATASLAAASVVPATAAAAAAPSGAKYTPAAASIHRSVHKEDEEDEEDDLPDGCDGVHPCGEEDDSARRQWYSHIVPVKDGKGEHGGGRPQRPTKAERDAARRRKEDEEEAALPEGCDGIHPCGEEDDSVRRQWYSNWVATA